MTKNKNLKADISIYLKELLVSMKKQNFLLWLILIPALYIFIHCIIYIFNYYSYNDILFHFPKSYKTPTDKINSLSPNEIGDSIGGILNPLIGLTAAVFTFLAFYVQYKSNNLIQEQFRLQQFENQFYEMLRIHRENINEMVVTGYDVEETITKETEKTGNELPELVAAQFAFNKPKTKNKSSHSSHIKGTTISGKTLFSKLKLELEFIFQSYKKIKGKEHILDNTEIEDLYFLFFVGLDDFVKHKKYFAINSSQYVTLTTTLKASRNKYNKNLEGLDPFFNDIGYAPFCGHKSILAQYYRHLYQTVKFVVKQNEQFISYEQQRNYLRILRVQLSNDEQAMLFYNWFSKLGEKWEDEQNHFFTHYRMIHNLYQELLIPECDLEKIFEEHMKEENMKKEKGRTQDPLFEYQDQQ